MMRKKSYVFMSVLLVLFLFVGCSKKEKINSQVKLRLAFYGDIRNKPFGEALIETFQKINPSFHIEPIFVIKEYSQKLLTMIAGGNAPDIMILSPSMMVDFASKGVLLNIQPYMDNDKEFQSFKYDIYPSSLESSKYQNIHYSVPFWINSLVLFYNKDLFDEKGISYPDKNWGWDNLLSAGKKITIDVNNDGKIDQYGFFSYFTLSDTFGGLYQYIRKNGGSLFNEDMSKCLIDSPKSVEAIRWCLDLISKHKITPSPFAGDERLRNYEQAFLSGKVAMTISGRWSIPWFSKARFAWGCVAQPKGKVEFKPSGATLLGAYSKTKYPEECWKFLKFMLRKEAQEIVCDLKADIPIRISVANSPKFLNWFFLPEENRIFLEELKGAEEFPHFPREKEWLDSAHLKIESVILGRKGLEITCKEIAEEYERIRRREK